MVTRARVAVLALALALLPQAARARPSAGRGAAGRALGKAHGSSRSEPRPSKLERARATLAALKRSPTKRRYRHNWERAIRELEKAARGADTGPALLDAARARYALYRFSAAEGDREKALALAARAAGAGAPRAAAFAAAVRREAGDDEPRVRPAKPSLARKGSLASALAASSVTTRSGTVASALPSAAAGAGDDEEANDPVLEDALGDAGAEEEKANPSRAEATAQPGEPAHVSEVRSWSNGDYTRVAVYLSHAVSFEKQELSSEDGRSRRLALDLKPAVLEGQALQKPLAGSLVRAVRAAQYGSDTVRVVLDLAGRDDAYQLFTLDDPPRLIVDVGTREAQRDSLAKGVQSIQSEPAAEEDEGEETGHRPVRRVIVDAGHGGHDTGAIGPHGVREKDVTLAMARRVARQLRAAGFEVVLTRSDDRYLRLEERTAIANMAHGDLFVSIHANAHPRRDRNGVETYFLNVTDDRYARRLAARENGVLERDEGAPGVQRILTDLNARASAGASRRLAQMVQRELTARVRQTEGAVRDLGVKHALFYVLLGARMPAVLVETAFISNREEEKRLASSVYQQLVADGVTRAVCRFAGRESRLAAR